MKTPSPGINVKQLVFLIARILLKLNFNQPIEVDRAQEALRQCLDFRRLDRLNISGCPAKLSRMLTHAPSQKCAVRSSIFEKRAVRQLAMAIARNNLLNHDLFRLDLSGSVIEHFMQFFRRVSAPSLRARRVKKVLFHRRLDRERKLRIEGWELVSRAHVPGLGSGNP